MRVAVPNKGRLHDPTVELLEKAGLEIQNGAERKLYAKTVEAQRT
jgi:ATP phosphoribosyltransferase